MDNQQALKLLDLVGGESSIDISTAYQTKLSALEDKITSAPTEVLKQKLIKMEDALFQAHDLLINTTKSDSIEPMTNENKPAKTSPLSQTKMHDLPGAGTQNNNESTLEIGSVLAERYQIKAFIAQGGMGAVYRAFDKNRNEDIAIKVMLPQLMQNESARERFLDEARLSSQLSHPNIVNVFDVIQDNDLCFLTMELLEGQDLRQLMENRKLVRQNFSLGDVIEIIEPICAGLDHAHELTVHRDIKPENIYLTEDGKYKLMDFGIAKVMSTSQRTQTGAASGTAYYMAPEQLKGAKNIDGRADQYALAVLTYELLSGEVPAGAIEPLHELVKGINKKISLNVQKALSPKPENRFDNLADFLQAIKGQGKGTGFSMPTLPMKGLGIAAAILITILGIGSIVGNGGLTSLWDAIKPVDKELITQQKLEAQRILNDKKAEVAKLQGEIKNYQKRLNNGQRNLKSDVRDAERNKSSELKYLQHWQRLSDDYLFDGDEIIELEGELSKGDNLLRQGTSVSIQQATTTLTQVRDGYKNLWAQFNAAENLLKAEEKSVSVFKQWGKRKKAYNLTTPTQARDASQSEEQAKKSQREGDFTSALNHLKSAEQSWASAYGAMGGQVAGIDRERKAEAAKIEQTRQAKIAKTEQIRQAKIAKMEEVTRARQVAVAAELAKKMGKYSDNGDGTVTDSNTDLMWMRCAIGQKWLAKTCKGNKSEHGWNAAKKIGRNKDYAGHGDWRLPSIKELESIIFCTLGKVQRDSNGYADGCPKGKGYKRPTINTYVFPGAGGNYWSSQPSSGTTPWGDGSRTPRHDGWAVSLYVGETEDWGHTWADDPDNDKYVRLVRSTR
jgi:serine/threonine protein kinase